MKILALSKITAKWATLVIMLIGFGFLAGYLAHQQRVFPLKFFVKRMLHQAGYLDTARRVRDKGLGTIAPNTTKISVESGYYTFEGTIHKLPIAEASSYGGIVAFGDDIIFVDGDGLAWFFSNGAFRQIGTKPVPNNKRAFLEKAETIDINEDQFAVKDIAIINGSELFVSAVDYDAAGDCVRLSVFRAPIMQRGPVPEIAGDWTSVFRSSPCLVLGEYETLFPHLLMAGGRIIQISDSEILFSVGTMIGLWEAGPDLAQDPTAHYGKIIKLDFETLESETFSTGVRNPQGLLRTRDGRVLETEHGPQGGDELNVILEGRNYGWPAVTFGTDYNELTWPLEKPDTLAAYEAPILAWQPSIAPSQLVEITSDDLPRWRGDLLISTLGGESLFRVHLLDAVPVLVEQIYTGLRTRDIIKYRGGFALQTDVTNELVLLQRVLD
jgi:hypothetical protein